MSTATGYTEPTDMSYAHPSNPYSGRQPPSDVHRTGITQCLDCLSCCPERHESYDRDREAYANGTGPSTPLPSYLLQPLFTREGGSTHGTRIGQFPRPALPELAHTASNISYDEAPPPYEPEPSQSGLRTSHYPTRDSHLQVSRGRGDRTASTGGARTDRTPSQRHDTGTGEPNLYLRDRSGAESLNTTTGDSRLDFIFDLGAFTPESPRSYRT